MRNVQFVQCSAPTHLTFYFYVRTAVIQCNFRQLNSDMLQGCTPGFILVNESEPWASVSTGVID